MYADSVSSPSWLDKLAACCSPPSPGFPPSHKPSRHEKEAKVWSAAPRLTPPPSFAPRPVDIPGNTSTRQLLSENGVGGNSNSSSPKSARSRRLVSRSRHGHSNSGSSTLIGTNTGRRSSHSLRRRLHTSPSLSLFPLPSALSSSSTRRRPQISAPTNFRHMQSGTFVFPDDQQQQIQQQQQNQPNQQQHQQQHQHPQQEPVLQEQQQQFQQQYLQHYAQQYRQQYQQQFQRRPPSFQPLDFTHLPSPLTSSFQRATTSDGNAHVQIPARVHTRDGSQGSYGSNGSNSNGQPPLDRSYSAMSFHLPRRPVGGCASSTRAVSRGNPSTVPSTANPAPPTIPVRSRLRSYSSPAVDNAVDNMVERIASAMLEVEKLQAEIDNVMERQSIYVCSRPSTAYGMQASSEHVNLPAPDDFCIFGMPPQHMHMPAVPAMPAAAPSFAERLSTDRPRTAPPRSSSLFPNGAPDMSSPSPSFGTYASTTTTTTNTAPIADADAASVASAAAKATKAKAAAVAKANASASSLQGSMRGGGSDSSHVRCIGGGGSRINGRPVDVPLAPPLPLVLRPPLRKKKSFSRVSTWLSFHHGQNGQNGGGSDDDYTTHGRGLSFESVTVTNAPRPVTESDGFYQCLAARTSMDSLASTSTVDTLSTWTTERDMAERRRGDDGDGVDEKDGMASGGCHRLGETTATAMTTPTTPSVAGIAGFIPVVAASTMAEKSAGLIAAHRPQSVGVAF